MRIYGKNDWFIDNIFTLSTNLICQFINHCLNLGEIFEFFSWNFIEFSPWSDIFRSMIKSQLQWSSSDDSITSWQKVQSNNGF